MQAIPKSWTNRYGFLTTLVGALLYVLMNDESVREWVEQVAKDNGPLITILNGLLVMGLRSRRTLLGIPEIPRDAP